jgi:hypothetical protein
MKSGIIAWASAGGVLEWDPVAQAATSRSKVISDGAPKRLGGPQ